MDPSEDAPIMPSQLSEDVVGMLEDAGFPQNRIDQVAKIIDDWEWEQDQEEGIVGSIMQIKIRQPVLFVDDDDHRCKMLEKMIGSDFVWAQTAPEAMIKLTEQQWATVMLDHDLEDDKHDGCSLCDHIVLEQARNENELFGHTNFIIHSVNSVGANKMHRILDRPELDLAPPSLIPFTQFVK